MQGVASMLHQVIKFVTPRGENTLYGDQVVEDLIRYELDESSLDRFFLTGANLKDREN